MQFNTGNATEYDELPHKKVRFDFHPTQPGMEMQNGNESMIIPDDPQSQTHAQETNTGGYTTKGGANHYEIDLSQTISHH